MKQERKMQKKTNGIENPMLNKKDRKIDKSISERKNDLLNQILKKNALTSIYID